MNDQKLKKTTGEEFRVFRGFRIFRVYGLGFRGLGFRGLGFRVDRASVRLLQGI